MTTALILTALLHAPPVVAQTDVKIRVRVRRELKNVELSGMDLRISAPGSLMPIEAPKPGINRARISRRDNGKWFVKWMGAKEESEWVESDALKVRGSMIRVGVQPVPYDLEIHKGKAGYDVVTSLDLETYLAGVIPSEMPASWPIEALKAQAVAARSFALRAKAERRSRHFDVDSTVMDQVFSFLHEAKSRPDMKAKVNRAITETRGQVLADTRGHTIKAYYSADCGCQSEDPKYVWGTVEAFQSVKDPSCRKRKPVEWDLSLERAEVRRRLLAELDLPSDTHLRALHVGGRTPSGRVHEVVASFDVKGELKTMKLPAQRFRKVFGFKRVRSADFSLRWLADQLIVNGTGLGHGVGLCQTGARALAEEGMDYRSILQLYYPRARLKTRTRV